ncbi:MAG: phosphoribosylformylglycinamidine synthase subunit PurQ [candidate division WOR-3 bacterium]
MIGVLQFPGSNCDLDIIHVIGHVLKEDVKLVFFKEQDLSGLDGLVIPGGFSYGDHLRAGAIAAKMPVMERVKRMAKEGKPILGICNGFQILCDSGLLPGALAKNVSMKFVCKWVELEVNNNSSAFTNLYRRGETIRMPIAHGEGRYFCDDATLKTLQDNGQIAFRYVDNPNGSLADIAGICNREGNVLGLMPHPERCSERILGGEDGIRVFEAMLNYIKSK